MWKQISEALHDDQEVLIKTRIGIVSAWYHCDAREWVCYDDAFAIPETADMLWMNIPEQPTVQRVCSSKSK